MARIHTQLTEVIRTMLLIINTTSNGPNSNKEGLQGLPVQTPAVQHLLHRLQPLTPHHHLLELHRVHLHRRLPLVVEATML
jgi:hypothetical protein